MPATKRAGKADPAIEAEPYIEQPEPNDTGAKRKPGRPKGAPATKRKHVRTRKPTSRLDKLEVALTDTFVGMGAPLAMALPITGLVWMDRAPQRAANLCRLAERNPRLLQALERLAAGSVAFDLIVDALAVGYACAVDLGRAEGDSAPARALGVADVYEMVVADEEREASRGNRSPLLDGAALAPAV